MYRKQIDYHSIMTAQQTDIFEKQNLFRHRMLEDYKQGTIPSASVFEPYFNWKMGKCGHSEITKGMAYMMMDEASALLEGYYEKYPRANENLHAYINEDPWQAYEGFGNDKYIVSYLESIHDELSNIAVTL